MGGAGCTVFISYSRADEAWARWIAEQLQGDGYRTVVQALDFRPGQDFVHRMHAALTSCDRTIAVLSPDYLESKFGEAEWQAVFAEDPNGERGLLIPVRVRACEPPGLLRSRIYIDLVGVSAERARQLLLSGVASCPSGEVPFPGRRRRRRAGWSTIVAIFSRGIQIGDGNRQINK